jgi:hypothetical protein
MANMAKGRYGKDHPEKMAHAEGFIEEALTGGSGPSEDIQHTPVDRPDQVINTAHAMDNVKLAMDIESSLQEEGGFHGDVSNLEHSLKGASAVNEEVGAAGPVKHIIIPNH